MTARRRALLPVGLLWLGAALASAVTLRRTLDPFDEGLLLQAASRIAAGEWPYADFSWAYGPGQALLNALAFELFEPTVVAWRAVRAAADASTAVLVWWLVRAHGGRQGWALAAAVAAALTLAQPTSANPSTVAFALATAALACAVARRPVAAGALVAVTAFWRPDFGVYAAVAVIVASLAAGAPREAARAVLTALVGAALLYAPFAVAAGPGDLWTTLVVDAVRDGGAWRLPFPVLYDGPLRVAHLFRDGKDALEYELPLLGVAGLLLAVAAAALRVPPGGCRAGRDPAIAGLLALGAGGLAYLLSRADDLHQQPLLVAVAALAAALAPRAPRALRAGLVAVLGLVALAGALNVASSVLRPPAGTALHLPGVPGILVAPGEARALPALVADVQARVPPGEPIYVAPARSDVVTLTDPLLHFLVRRPNVLDADAQVLNDPEIQRDVVATLRARPPRVVVRWTDPRSAQPEENARGRPSGATALDAFLAERYALAARHGAYDVLTLRP
jgi:hypothetical protein